MSLIYIDFPGASLNAVALEAHTMRSIKPQLLSEEPGLYQSKWFDYRVMHHAKATMLYAAFFNKALRDLWARYEDIEEADAMFGQQRLMWDRSGRALTGFWKGRQAADRLGVPYGIYVYQAMKRLYENGMWVLNKSRRKDKGRQALPDPTQLYGEDVQGAALAYWEELSRVRLFTAEHHFFTAPYYEDHPDQNAYYRWLVNELRNRPDPKSSVADLMTGREVLPRSIAVAEFGERVVREALS